MSKSLARVKAALAAHGIDAPVLEMPQETRTAPQAAEAAGCALDQIVKSILFRGEGSGQLRLFLTAGGNQVCADKASALAGEALGRADADQVRKTTGFAIGGVAPIGHLTPLPCWFDARLLEFPQVWAAAGTPRHIFAAPPHLLLRITAAHLADFTA
ncbi:YbaK/EbsC family protein [Rhodobacter ferrooxidans]|uniref:YbaK/prolyl-tRNA synthetase associated region n=1 Tax=Rhodobacter ferrooxidans TaxID=371731 RepID=C8RXY2_9RHOB|nr:YbaK/EbsC family protein [Rhodobacter sp. SW2]EEW26380.1 YbaK/prolyl-tRNA synthetase associated region [Rhodobacter sp. SW2]